MKKTFLIVWGKTYSTGVIPSEYSRYLRLLWMSYFRIGNSIFTWNRPRETILEKLQEWIWCSVSIQSSIFPFYFFALPLNRRRIYFLGGGARKLGFLLHLCRTAPASIVWCAINFWQVICGTGQRNRLLIYFWNISTDFSRSCTQKVFENRFSLKSFVLGIAGAHVNHTRSFNTRILTFWMNIKNKWHEGI